MGSYCLAGVLELAELEAAQPEQGDLQVNLSPKAARSRTSHDIALDVRKRLAGLSVPEPTSIKVVEVPPGPPVLATLLAEVYGPDPETRRAVAAQLRAIFRSVPFIVDDDDSFGVAAPRQRVAIDQDNLEFYKVDERDVYDTLQAYLSGVPVGYSHRGGGRHPIEIAVQLPKRDLVVTERGLAIWDGKRGRQYAMGRITNVPGLFFSAPVMAGSRLRMRVTWSSSANRMFRRR